MKTLPGPVNVVLQQPSPPKQHMHKRPLGVIPSETEFSIMLTDRLSTVIVSPSFKYLYTGVPPAATNKTLSLVPLIFWRKQPNPAQQQVRIEQSKSQAVYENRREDCVRLTTSETLVFLVSRGYLGVMP